MNLIYKNQETFEEWLISTNLDQLSPFSAGHREGPEAAVGQSHSLRSWPEAYGHRPR